MVKEVLDVGMSEVNSANFIKFAEKETFHCYALTVDCNNFHVWSLLSVQRVIVQYYG